MSRNGPGSPAEHPDGRKLAAEDFLVRRSKLDYGQAHAGRAGGRQVAGLAVLSGNPRPEVWNRSVAERTAYRIHKLMPWMRLMRFLYIKFNVILQLFSSYTLVWIKIVRFNE
jgi:hypothetical protein